MGNNSCRCILCGMDIVLGDIMDEMDSQRNNQKNQQIGAQYGARSMGQHGAYGPYGGGPKKHTSVMSGKASVIIYEGQAIVEDALLEDMCEKADIECDGDATQLTADQQSKLMKRLSMNPRTESFFKNEHALNKFVTNHHYGNAATQNELNHEHIKDRIQSIHSKMSINNDKSRITIKSHHETSRIFQSLGASNHNVTMGGQTQNKLKPNQPQGLQGQPQGHQGQPQGPPPQSIDEIFNARKYSTRSSPVELGTVMRPTQTKTTSGQQQNLSHKVSQLSQRSRFSDRSKVSERSLNENTTGSFGVNSITAQSGTYKHSYQMARQIVESNEKRKNNEKGKNNEKRKNSEKGKRNKNETAKDSRLDKAEKQASSGWSICNCTESRVDDARFQKPSRSTRKM